MRLEELQLLLQTLGHRDIVGVHPRDEFAAGLFDASIEDRPETPIRSAGDELYPGIGVGQATDDPVAPVGRPVIDDQELEVLNRLVLDAANGVLQTRESVVHAHENRDWRGWHGLRSDVD
jgi:hypothetical protein